MATRASRYAVTIFVIGLAAASLAQAGARHGRRTPLLSLAHEIEESARHLRHGVAQPARYGAYSDRQVLRRLDALEHHAGRFCRDVTRYGPYSVRVADDFNALRRAHRYAREALQRRPAPPATRKGFRRIDYLMRELRYEYETHLASHGRGRPPRARRTDPHGPVGYVHVERRGHGDYVAVGIVWDGDD